MIIRDPAYLRYLRTQRCIITGQYGDDRMSVVPMHIGTAGKGIKSPDSQALPIIQSLHMEGHNSGEISMLRHRAPDLLMREAFRALAEKHYWKWKEGQ